MAKLQFEADPPQYPDAWAKLNTVAEFLEDGESLPPHLAQWLVHAIRMSGKDAGALLVNLDLKNPRGRKPTAASDWLDHGGRVCDLESEGMAAEAALSLVLAEMNESVSRATLQNWRDIYRNAMAEINAIE